MKLYVFLGCLLLATYPMSRGKSATLCFVAALLLVVTGSAFGDTAKIIEPCSDVEAFGLLMPALRATSKPGHRCGCRVL